MNRRQVLEGTLDAIAAQTRPVDAICVVDNASSDDTAEFIRSEKPDIELICLDDNTGPAGGMAVGIAHAVDDCDAVLMFDDDSRPPPTLVQTLLQVLDGMPDVGIVGTKGMLLRWGNPHHGIRWERQFGDIKVQGVDCCHIDAALARADVIRDVGVPDPEFFIMYTNDYEYTNRIKRHGYEVAIVPIDVLEVERLHMGSTNPWRAYYQTRNQLLVALDRKSPTLVLGWAWRTGKFIVAAAATKKTASADVIRYRLRGAKDGFANRRGRTIDPTMVS
jgi:GT2 family glycosyltransferase